MKKFLALLLALVMALSLVACGQKADTNGGSTTDGDTQTQTQTQTDTQSVDLRAAYDAAIKQVQDELGDDAPVLLEETSADVLESIYPGIGKIEMKQAVYFLSVTMTSCEVSMVEVANASDAETVRQIFQSRVDGMANDTEYVYEAAMWKNNATITVNGNYVVLEVLPDGCTVPDAFLAKF